MSIYSISKDIPVGDLVGDLWFVECVLGY